MRSSKRLIGLAATPIATAVLLWAARATADPAQGFGVERLYLSAPGGGWIAMDTLDMHGGLGGAAAMTVDLAHDSLRIGPLSVVREEVVVDLGVAVTYERFRLYLDFDTPLVVHGTDGTVGNDQFTGPAVDVAKNPDLLTDARIGFDMRILGKPHDYFRLGAGAQFFIPNGNPADYVTDGTYRAMFRALFAGDVGLFTYAGHVGVHVRPLDETPVLGSPQGSELLFGIAAGAKMPIDHEHAWAIAAGPELYGATAFRTPFGKASTSLEGMLTGRLEGTKDRGPQLRIKLGFGAGLSQELGTPEWRFVFGLEVFDHRQAPKGGAN